MEDVEKYYYVNYVCRFCNQDVLEQNLETHQKECEE